MTAEALETGLIGRVRSGDPDALSELFERFGERVHEVAYRITGSRDDADDVLQDVFVGLPEALRGYDGTGRLDAWLSRIATRSALLRLRGEKRRMRRQHQSLMEHDRSVATQPAHEARLTLERALERVPQEQRVVYVLKEVEGYSHAEIADMLGITKGASEVRLHRARRFLLERLRGKL